MILQNYRNEEQISGCKWLGTQECGECGYITKGQQERFLCWNCGASWQWWTCISDTIAQNLTYIHTSECRCCWGNLGRDNVLYQDKYPGWDIVLCYCRMLPLRGAVQVLQQFLCVISCNCMSIYDYFNNNFNLKTSSVAQFLKNAFTPLVYFVPTNYASYSLYFFPSFSPFPSPLITLHVISIPVILFLF